MNFIYFIQSQFKSRYVEGANPLRKVSIGAGGRARTAAVRSPGTCAHSTSFLMMQHWQQQKNIKVSQFFLQTLLRNFCVLLILCFSEKLSKLETQKLNFQE